MRGHASDQLTAYIDGTLPQEEAAEVAAHLAECEHCHSQFDDLLAVRSLLRSLPVPTPRPSLLPGTLAYLQRRRTRRLAVPSWIVAAAVGAVAATLILQLRLLPPTQDPGTGAWYFQRHAELSSTHPMADVTMASYLSSALPYAFPPQAPGVEEGP